MTKKKEEPENIFESILQERESLTEKMVYETSKQLFNTDLILMIADLNNDQINYFYKLILMDELFYQHYATTNKFKFTRLFEKMLQLTISKNRQSRNEIVTMFQIQKVVAEQEQAKKGLLRR